MLITGEHVQIQPESTEMVGALARCRQTVLERANVLLNPGGTIPPVERVDVLPGVTGLLMTSLEELKVAEEELRQQNATLATQRAVVDERLRHYRQLFLYSPAPAIITDVYGSIQEVNLAAAALFRREVQHLERKPLAALLPVDRRDVFRRRLTDLLADGEARDWPLTFKRLGDTPLSVCATVQLVPGVGATGSGVLYWLLRVESTAT